MSFRKGNAVRWSSPRTRAGGYGKITEIKSTGRGVWYVVKRDDGSVITLRAAQLELV